MSSLSITAITFGCTFGGALLGMALRARLPHEHLSADTKETVKLAAGIVGTMTAILLGLLVASAKSSFDAQRNGVAQLAASFIMLDRNLAHYGDETQPIRELLQASLVDVIQRTWPDENASLTRVAPTSQGVAGSGSEGRYEAVAVKILELAPNTDSQRSLKSQAFTIVENSGQSRWLLFAQRETSIPEPLLVLVVFWLTISFASFGLFAPRNSTAVLALFACSLAVASALFLVLELDRPFQGAIQIPSTPLHKALDQLGR